MSMDRQFEYAIAPPTITRIRKIMGLSQRAFAKHLRVTTCSVNNWETGRINHRTGKPIRPSKAMVKTLRKLDYECALTLVGRAEARVVELEADLEAAKADLVRLRAEVPVKFDAI